MPAAMSVLRSLAARIDEYEDAEKLDACLEFLPLERIYKVAEDDVAHSQRPEDERVLIALLKWFKEHFRWVNAARCRHCGNGETKGARPVPPTAEERLHGAGTTELWHCEQCGADTRFPRYNSITKLLETSEGRCGEWCTVMTYLLRALGYDVRYVWNSEDHVWNEVWLPARARWVHVDACEAAFDQPLLYADGWGKKMAYVVAFSRGGCKDVTRRYVRRADAALPRTMFDEALLVATLAELTARRRADMDPVELVEWFERDEGEERELQALATVQPSPTEPYLPRQSGSAAWTAARGEDGV